MTTDVDIQVTRVETAIDPLQDEDIDLYADQLRGYTIVDVDVHMDDTLTNMVPYIEGYHQKRLESLLQNDFKGEPGNSLRNMIAHVFHLGSNYDKAPRAKLASKTDLMARMNRGIIDYSILFPSELLPIGYLPDEKWAAALAETYNRYMVDNYSNLPGIKIGLLVAPQMPEHAAREIRSYADRKDVVAVCVPDIGVNPPIGNHKYLPIFEAAAECNLPIAFHGIESLLHGNYPLRVSNFSTLLELYTIGFPFTAMLQIISVVGEGIPARFPNLKFCVLEAGITWMPFIMYRLDASYRRHRTETPELTKRPSDYIREWGVGTHELEELAHPGDLARTIALYGGEDTTMWASDWPHQERDLLGGIMRYELSDAMRKKILGQNAVRFFALDGHKAQ
jgi:uncharacterized protein